MTHAHPWRLNTHLRQQVQAVVLTQTQVEEAQVEHLTMQQRFGLRRTAGAGNVIAFVFQAVAEGPQDCRFVVHQQNSSAGLL
jgi:hypothetical protein